MQFAEKSRTLISLLSDISLNLFLDCLKFSACLRCNVNGCQKCTNYIMQDSKKCVASCPVRYISQWSSSSELMGRTCVPSYFSNYVQTLLFGCVFGALLCILSILLAVKIFRKKRQRITNRSIKDQLIGDDRSELLRQLDDLRPCAEFFLSILNDTRKEIRNSCVLGDNTAATILYPVICDLAKILILLNRPIESIDGSPYDWNRLLQWAEIILIHYKPQQASRLIEFFQITQKLNGGNIHLVDEDNSFKSLFYSTPVIQSRAKSILGPVPSTAANFNSSTFEVNYENNNDSFHLPNIIDSKKHQFESDEIDVKLNRSLMSLQDFIKSNEEGFQKSNRDSFEHFKNYLSKGSLLVVDDELIEFKLGLRPQDEIITEL